jgi:hypothetical protein
LFVFVFVGVLLNYPGFFVDRGGYHFAETLEEVFHVFATKGDVEVNILPGGFVGMD